MDHVGNQARRRRTGQRSVSLFRHGAALVLTRSCPEADRALQRLAALDGTPGGRVAPRSSRWLGRLPTHAGKRWWCMAGFEPVLTRVLRDQGIDVRRDGFVPPPLPAPAGPLLPPELPPDPALLTFVRQADRGLVRFRAGQLDLAWLIAQVARAWPTRRIAVVARRVEDADQLRDRVGRWLPNVTASSSRSRAQAPGRVAVVTESYLERNAVVSGGRDLIIAVNALEAVSRRCQESLLTHDTARMYGLLPAGAAVAPLDEALLRGWFGFHEVALAGHGLVERAVEVRRVPVPAGPPVSPAANLLELKRAAVWHRADRNALVARLGCVDIRPTNT